MKLITKSILAGALALAGAAASAPASALPAGPLTSVAVDASIAAAPIETVRYRRVIVRRHFFGPRHRFYRGRRYGYRRGLPGHPIRRLLRAL